MPFFHRYIAVAALLAAPLAQAACSREIAVPVANTGASIVIDGARVTGIYPELLRTLGPKEGCHFNFSPVPRARLELMFETGKADILIPATRTATRDINGIFVPMMRHRATLISVASSRPAITTGQELLERRDIRVAVVRGFDYGEAYQGLIRELNKQGRLFTEVDPTAVARLMHLGAVDMTIMGPTILAGVINREPRVSGLLEKLRLEPIPELPWQSNGVYVSRRSLSAEDQAALVELLEKAAKSGAVLEAFQRYHRADIMSESVRPR